MLLAVVRRGVVYSDSQLQSLELEEEELLRFFEASESILPNDKLSQLLVTHPFVYPFSTEAACISSNIQGRAKELRHMEEALERSGWTSRFSWSELRDRQDEVNRSLCTKTTKSASGET